MVIYFAIKKEGVTYFRAQSFVRNTDFAALLYSANKKRLRDNHRNNFLLLKFKQCLDHRENDLICIIASVFCACILYNQKLLALQVL